MAFWSYRKNGLITKTRLVSKFMTSQSGQQTITIQLLPVPHEVKANRQWTLVNQWNETSAKTLVPQTLHFFLNYRKSNSNHRARNSYNSPQFNIKHNFFKNYFFSSVIAEWNKLDSDIRNLNSLKLFKSRILNFIQPNPNSIFNCHNPKAIKYLSRLGLSHLREQKFKHSFQDTLNPICACGSRVITSSPALSFRRNEILSWTTKTNRPKYLKFESLSNYSRSSLWWFFSKKRSKYWNFEQHYELYSLNKEVWSFYF